MKKLHEILKNGTLPVLKARRRQLKGYIKKIEGRPESRDEILDVTYEIWQITDRIKELEG